MKKFIALFLAVLMVVAVFAGCSSNGDTTTKANADDTATEELLKKEPIPEAVTIDPSTVTVPDDFKVGFIFLHDETSTYDKNFIDAANAACEALGIKKENILMKTGIAEDTICTETALDLIDQGCKYIFADSFGHESFLIEAAKANPDVQFFHATGTRAHTEGLDNYHNAFASIYEGRYLAGVAAGMKLNELKDAGKLKGDVPKMGYVGAFTYAEVMSGYTSFYLGAKSVCPDVVMDVTFTGSWYDEAAEKTAAEKLIASGADLISQHADSMGAPSACEAAGIPNVSYNGSTVDKCPNTFIVSSRINWAPYMIYSIANTVNGTASEKDWTGTIATDSVVLTDINEKVAAAGTAEKIAEVKADLEAGKINVFDTKNFTVGGKTLTSAAADIDSDENMAHESEAIVDGVYKESVFRSAPYFDLEIDGITLLDKNFG